MEQTAPLPPSLTITRNGDELAIRWRWYQPWWHRFLLLFAIAWNAIVIAIVIALFAGGDASDDMLFVMPLFGVFGVGLLYGALTAYVNHTRIVARPDRLEVHHGPLPWYRDVTLSRAQIRQIFVANGLKVNGVMRHNVCAELGTGAQRALLRGLGQRVHAQQLERELENHLGITDFPVDGEARRK